jgi:hypothetical protein
MKKWIRLLIISTAVLAAATLFGQGKPYEGPDDPAGDKAARREGWMTGNRVLEFFQNTTEISYWPRSDASRWPNTYTGQKMNDGIGLLIGGRVFITGDSIPVEGPNEIRSLSEQGLVDTLFYLQTNYREQMDPDPSGTFYWGLYPPFGYFDRLSESPAMSNDATSWPPEGWPMTNHDKKWPGFWNGRFGMGITYADLETFFVANDAQDQENLQPSSPVKYYPRPGVFINSDNTCSPGKPWGGLGIRVEVRGMQWNNPEARDALFFEYTIANISEYDINDVAFGYWIDCTIGDDSNDEIAAFDKIRDLAYTWDINGIGRGGFPTGTSAYAFLESPGNSWDQEDNNDNGIVDEKRDNQPTKTVGPTESPNEYPFDVEKFLTYTYQNQSNLGAHWDADEDQDWMDGLDANGNGRYDIGEGAGDDVGLDGVGPGEIQYSAPDEGECNHKPDFREGVGCEPNFDATDIGESDMLGLTSFRLFPIPGAAAPYTNWFRNDQSMWNLIGTDSLIQYLGIPSNVAEVFGSGPFALYQGRTERVSMAELHSFDDLSGLNAITHDAPVLFNLKRMVQLIYERDYRFASAPLMPTLTATPGDGFVVLSWDNIADTRSREPFLANINDFEGYKLFRASDKKMSDTEQITDGFGTKMFKKPIFQCDVRDGKKGFTEFGLMNGMGYYLGEDKGLTHSFIDNTVQNGRTYYYAVVAYDYGIEPDQLKQSTDKTQKKIGISPAENNVVIELDEAENVKFIGKNAAVVIPGPKPVGQETQTEFEVRYDGVLGSGKITPALVAENALVAGRRYGAVFMVDTIRYVKSIPGAVSYGNKAFRVLDLTSGQNPAPVVYEDVVRSDTAKTTEGTKIRYTDIFNTIFTKDTSTIPRFYIKAETTTDIFDGLQLKFEMPCVFSTYDPARSVWNPGSAPINITLAKETPFVSWDYNLVYTSNPQEYTTRSASTLLVYDENGLRIKGGLLDKLSYSFYVENLSFKDASGSFVKMDIMTQDLNGNGVYDPLEDRVLVGALNNNGRWNATAFIFDFANAASAEELPKPGDVYQVRFNRPFWSTDTVRFHVKSRTLVGGAGAGGLLDRIMVVPNPYVATDAMEPSVANYQLNQRRRLMFTHVPARCAIKIFTMSGVLVDEIIHDSAAPAEGFVTSNGGVVHWDMKNKDGLEIAAGVYLFHVKDTQTGEEKMGKFAVIK